MSDTKLTRLPRAQIEEILRISLSEDLGLAGDLTTNGIVHPDSISSAKIVARDSGIICGLEIAETTFAQLLNDVNFVSEVMDGDRVEPGQTVAVITGNARAILSTERVALNFMCHLSGIATQTAKFVASVEHTQAKICDTRKTIPGMRAFQKYAVRCGGGANHRFGLYDAVLIKDNHIAVAGSVSAAIEAARAYVGHLVAIEVEVDCIDELKEALSSNAEAVLLDNFDVDTLRKAVRLVDGQCRLEASGRVRLNNVAAIAETGVDYISSSQITMSAPVLDIGLDFSDPKDTST